ncbi:MAG: 50S ribosomal protein L32 [Actinobacteria bacterium]|nr:50S ribosomal protein L32 [Actinomycetota bacterium]
MAVPKRRTSRSRHRSRHAVWAGKSGVPDLVECPQCHEMKMPHRVCTNCGYYRDRQAIEVE